MRTTAISGFSQVVPVVNNLPVNEGDVRDTSSLSGLGRCPGGACRLSLFSHLQIFATLWTVTFQAPLFMGLSRQDYGSGLPCPPSGDLSNLGIQPMSPAAPALKVGSLLLSQQRRRSCQPPPVFLPGESHGQRSPAGYSP